MIAYAGPDLDLCGPLVPNRGEGPCLISLCAIAYPPGPRCGGSDSGGEGQVPLARGNSLEHIFKTEDCKPNLNSGIHK